MRPPRLDKALGQHHLVSGSLCRPLIEFLQPAGQRVVEVGPGGGVLTAELLAAALLGALLPHHRRVPRAAFLVQREVAERLLAGPGDPAYGSFSVLVAAYARAVPLGRVRRGSFRPPPKVEGAYVGFELRPPPLPEGEMPAFLTTVRLAFGQRRKTLRNALAAGWGRERAGAVLAALGLPDDTRAERLGLAELLALHCGARPVGT